MERKLQYPQPWHCHICNQNIQQTPYLMWVNVGPEVDAEILATMKQQDEEAVSESLQQVKRDIKAHKEICKTSQRTPPTLDLNSIFEEAAEELSKIFDEEIKNQFQSQNNKESKMDANTTNPNTNTNPNPSTNQQTPPPAAPTFKQKVVSALTSSWAKSLYTGAGWAVASAVGLTIFQASTGKNPLPEFGKAKKDVKIDAKRKS